MIKAVNEKFSISRLHTSQGVFRLEGVLPSLGEVSITKIEILGTDGWLLLALSDSKVMSLCDNLHGEILLHLS